MTNTHLVQTPVRNWPCQLARPWKSKVGRCYVRSHRGAQRSQVGGGETRKEGCRLEEDWARGRRGTKLRRFETFWDPLNASGMKTTKGYQDYPRLWPISDLYLAKVSSLCGWFYETDIFRRSSNLGLAWTYYWYPFWKTKTHIFKNKSSETTFLRRRNLLC